MKRYTLYNSLAGGNRYIQFLYLYNDLYMAYEVEKVKLIDEPNEYMKHQRQQRLTDLKLGMAMVMSELTEMEKKYAN